MGDRKVGPVCVSKVGGGWIDGGTLCRARSGAPGPAGMVLAMVLGATPKPALTDEQSATMAMIDYDIGLIAKSPFGKTKEGGRMVQLLRELNRRGDVLYGETFDDSRGDWDGKTIRINENARGKMYPTVLELVHEASHALWRKRHPAGKVAADVQKQNVDDELHAQENQLDVYVYLRDKLGCPKDLELELRLERRANGELRKAIEERFGLVQ